MDSCARVVADVCRRLQRCGSPWTISATPSLNRSSATSSVTIRRTRLPHRICSGKLPCPTCAWPEPVTSEAHPTSTLWRRTSGTAVYQPPSAQWSLSLREWSWGSVPAPRRPTPHVVLDSFCDARPCANDHRKRSGIGNLTKCTSPGSPCVDRSQMGLHQVAFEG